MKAMRRLMIFHLQQGAHGQVQLQHWSQRVCVCVCLTSYNTWKWLETILVIAICGESQAPIIENYPAPNGSIPEAEKPGVINMLALIFQILLFFKI